MVDFFEKSAVLKIKPFAEPAAQILSELAEDESKLKNDFLSDPSSFFAGKLYGAYSENIPKSTLNDANKFLFSALSNKKFCDWIEAYSDELKKELESGDLAEIDKDKLRMDLAEAMIDSADPSILLPAMSRSQRIGGVTFNSDDPLFDPDGKLGLKSVAPSVAMMAHAAGPSLGAAIGSELVPAAFSPKIYDVAVEIETLVYAVAVAAVFVAAIGVVLAMTSSDDFTAKINLTKDISVSGAEMNMISEALVERAAQLRSAGKL